MGEDERQPRNWEREVRRTEGWREGRKQMIMKERVLSLREEISVFVCSRVEKVKARREEMTRESRNTFTGHS